MCHAACINSSLLTEANIGADVVIYIITVMFACVLCVL